jgi:glyoxylase-like metal-dependent hydrolase (beta-lactamase superfamily II)
MALRHSTQGKTIHTIDLGFMGLRQAIAVYVIPHQHGAILVESGPGSTIPALQAGLKALGLSIQDIRDVFLTHIHLDHAGAAGWLARQGARIHVHPVGAPHLLNPEKLLASAGRIYGELMQSLWGEFLPVPEGQLSVLRDGEVVEVNGLSLRALDTPGHANHHFVYLFEDVCFSGDIGGVRIGGVPHLRLPMPPPEFNLEKWQQSLARLRSEKFSRIAPTHFGLYADPDWQLAAVQDALDEIEAWMEAVLPQGLPVEVLNDRFLEWTRSRSLAAGLPPDLLGVYEAANPSWMSTQGILRYWEKYRRSEK